MTISIIIPVYNTEAYLPACLDSILSQRFTDFEVLLVDDGVGTAAEPSAMSMLRETLVSGFSTRRMAV